jgi:aldehyde:ferredoxin oxidoreductase
MMCKFSSFALSEEEYAHLLSAVTGKNYKSEDILKVGDRIYNLERHINCEMGFGMNDDTLPERMFSGINKSDFENALEEYYRFRGWVNGIPSPEKLSELDI